MRFFDNTIVSCKLSVKTILLIIFAVFAFKFLYVLLHGIYMQQWPVNFNELAKIFCYNDAGWYQNIAENGYPVIANERDLGYLDATGIQQSSWAFFPLYPLLCKGLMVLFTCDFYTASFLLSLILLPLVAVLFFKLVLFFKPSLQFAWFTLLLLLSFPFHYQLFMSYTEALFLTGLFLSVLGILERRSAWLIIGTVILVLTRPNGLLTLLPLWLLLLEQSGNLLINFKNKWPSIIRKSMVFLPAGFIFLAYLYYQYDMTGYYNAFSIAQRGWGKSFMFPFFAFFKFNTLENQVHSVYCILIMLFVIWQAKKMPLSLHVLIWVNILLPLTAGSTISIGRYLIVLFPVWILLSDKIMINAKVNWALLLVIFAMQIYFFQYWPIAHSMGY